MASVAQALPSSRCAGRSSSASSASSLRAGVFAFGLSKQGQVARLDTAHVTVPPAGFQMFAAAPIAGTALDGTGFSIAALRGKPAFINVWAARLQAELRALAAPGSSG